MVQSSTETLLVTKIKVYSTYWATAANILQFYSRLKVVIFIGAEKAEKHRKSVYFPL